jgi:hypothetical protein
MWEIEAVQLLTFWGAGSLSLRRTSNKRLNAAASAGLEAALIRRSNVF